MRARTRTIIANTAFSLTLVAATTAIVFVWSNNVDPWILTLAYLVPVIAATRACGFVKGC
jgi:uncharacterized membrane protein YfcA